MILYKGEINVGSPPGKPPIKHTVFRGVIPGTEMTAAEIVVLRHIHGDDCLSGVESLGDANIDHRKERARLAAKYGDKVIETLFGPAAAASRLPEQVDINPADNMVDAEDVPENLDAPALAEPKPSPAKRATLSLPVGNAG